MAPNLASVILIKKILSQSSIGNTYLPELEAPLCNAHYLNKKLCWLLHTHFWGCWHTAYAHAHAYTYAN